MTLSAAQLATVQYPGTTPESTSETSRPPNSDLFVLPQLRQTSLGAQVAWYAYGAARVKYLHDHGVPIHLGPIPPSFEEEVLARATMVRIYEANHDPILPSDPYLKNLAVVQNAGFMEEYVWVYLAQPTWGNPPSSLELKAFDQWRRRHLPRHEPLTLVGVGTHPDSLSR